MIELSKGNSFLSEKIVSYDRERIEINGQLYDKYTPVRSGFISPTGEPIVPFARNKLSTTVPKFFIIEGNH